MTQSPRMWNVVCAAATMAAAIIPVFARAQTPRPDLAITQATFDGAQLHVEYINAGGVYDRRRYEVGFQWYDAYGQAVGVRHWLPVPEVERGGVSILDNRSRTELSYKRGRDTYGRRLSQFIEDRPSNAIELRVTVDDGDRIPERDETNNIARLKIPLPDIVVRGVFLSGDTLAVTYANPSGASVSSAFRIAFQWTTSDGVAVDREYWTQVGQLGPKEERRFPSSFNEILSSGSDNRQTYRHLATFIRERPARAAFLRVTADAGNGIAESNEQNNVEHVRVAPPEAKPTPKPEPVPAPKPEPQPLPPPELPDLTITDATLDNAALRFWVSNRGKRGTDSGVSYWYEWVDAAGQRVGDLFWVNVDAIPAGAKRQGNQLMTATLTHAKGTARLEDVIGFPPPSATHLKLAVDGPNAHAEQDEQNNAVLLPAMRADLTITDATLADDTLSFRAHNRGNLSTVRGVSYWLEWVDARGRRVDDLHWANADDLGGNPANPGRSTELGKESALTSAKGATTFGAMLASAPTSATHLKLHIDGPNRYAERDETNNTALLPRPVQPLPDIVARDAQLTADGLAVTFANTGDGAASSVPWAMVWVAADGQPIGAAFRGAWPALAPKGTIAQIVGVQPVVPGSAVAYLVQPPDSAERLRITVNPEGIVAESDAGNNTAEVARLPRPPQVVATPPDLVAGDAAVRDGALVIPVANRGTTASVATDLWIQWYGKGRWMPGSGAADIPAIAGGATADVAIPLDRVFGPDGKLLTDIPKDAEKLRVFLDGLRKVAESDENNNTLMVPRSLFPIAALPPKPAAQPDLHVLGIESLTGDAIVVKMVNRGAGASPIFAWTLQWEDANGVLLGTPMREQGIAMVPGYGYNVTIDAKNTGRGSRFDPFFGSPPKGAVRVRATVDPDSAIAEDDEANNAATWSLPTLPDLVFSGIEEWGTQITARVVNRGKGKAPVFRWEFQWEDAGGKLLGKPLQNDGVAMVPNYTYGYQFEARDTRRGTDTDTFFRTAPAGATRIRFTVDPANAIAESDEANNTTTWTPLAPPKPEEPPKPDLVIERLRMSPAAPEVGETVDVLFTITNRGGVVGASVAMVAVDLDGDGEADMLPEEIDVPGIAATSSTPIAWKDAFEVAEGGTMTITACADAEEAIAETKEENNCVSLDVSVPDAGAQRPQRERKMIARLAEPVVGVVGALFGATPIAASEDDARIAFFHSRETKQPTIPDAPATATPSAASLAVPLPNLTIASAWFQFEGNLIIRYANTGGATLPPAQSAVEGAQATVGGVPMSNLSFWFAWADDRGDVLSAPGWFWLDTVVPSPAPGVETSFVIRPDGTERFVPHGLGASAGLTPTAFLRTQPAGATQLLVIIDGPNAYVEADDDDNTAAAALLAPNLQLRDAVLAPDTTSLTVTFANEGATTLRPPAGRERVSVQFGFAWRDAAGQPARDAATYTTGWAYTSIPAASASQPVMRDGGAWKFAPVGGGAMLTFTDLLRAAPADARTLVITVDAVETIAETREHDNVVTVAIPQLPNLQPVAEDNGNGDFVFGYENIGAGAIPLPAESDRARVPLWFAWADASGSPLPTTTWYWNDITLYASDRARQPGERFSRRYRDDDAHLGIRRQGDPVTAASRLTIGDVFREAPAGAAALLVTADGPNDIVEQDEQNNAATLAATVPRPDLRPVAWQEYQREDDGGFTVTFENIGMVGVPTRRGESTDVPVSVWFVWGDSAGRPHEATRWYWRDDFTIDAAQLTPGSSSRGFRLRMDSRTLHHHGVAASNAALTLADVLAERPSGATHLLAFIDGANRVVESNEGNNMLVVPMPAPEQGQEREQEPAPAQGQEQEREPEPTPSPASPASPAPPVSPAPVPTFSIRAEPLLGSAPLRVQFRGESSGGALSGITWILGDGTTTRVDVWSLEHTYAEPGTYVVTAKAMAAGGVIVRAMASIVVEVPSAPPPAPPTTRRLTQPTGRPLPDPSPASPASPSSPASPAPAPAPAPPPAPPPLTVTVSASPEEGEPPLAVQFTATVSGGMPPYQYLWLFSDGVSADVASLERTFPRVGSREAVIQVRDSAGASVSGQTTVRVRLNEPPPDLVVEDLRVTPDTGGEDVARSVTATIRNVGATASVPTVAWFTYDLDGDDTPDALPPAPRSLQGEVGETTDVPALTPGATATIAWRDALRAPVGTHAVDVCADAEQDDAEGDERNNCAQVTFVVQAPPEPAQEQGRGQEPASEPSPPPAPLAKLPNLSVFRSTVSPPAPVVGDQPTFTTEIRNVGEGDAPATTAALTIDSDGDGEPDAGPFTASVPPLAAGAWTRPTWERVVSAVAGTHVAQFCADPDRAVAEASDADNCGQLTVTVTEPPPPPPEGTTPRRRLLY